ncbi:MAG TPA: efflux RND transporter periplasmic adaptor subunit [Polyangiaceae bacterium]|jgi:RND family efflux transporter MFP subunit|nr:efflux RND transporter periplasmic adaptor subunit [Polyangiaceae bacterium]
MTFFDSVKAHASVLVLASIGLAVSAYEWHQLHAATPPAGSAPAARPAPTVVVAEGRLVAYPDAQVTLGAEVAGRLAELRVHEGDAVKKGDVLAVVDVAEQRAALREARARVKEVDSDVTYLARERQRSAVLLAQNAVASAAFERSEHDADGAERRRASLVAVATRLEAEVTKATVVAPFSGTIVARFVEPGAYVAPGTSIATLCDLSRLRVQAEVGEFDTARVTEGAKATLSAEGYREHWRGTLEELPAEVVARQQRPLDPSRPVDTRVLLAKIRLDEPLPLRLGQRIEVEIATTPARSAPSPL